MPVPRPRLRIRTWEQRFILESATALEEVLRRHGSAVQYIPGRSETLLTTVYVDTASGTWSTQRSALKLRTRSYGDADIWWLELKRREAERVDKRRRSMGASEVMENLTGENRWRSLAGAVGTEPLQPVFAVQCGRTAYNWTRLRVTLDRRVTFYSVDPAQPLTLRDPIGRINGIVVEVKSARSHPGWLSAALDGYGLPEFSKSRCGLALIKRSAQPFLETAAQLVSRT